MTRASADQSRSVKPNHPQNERQKSRPPALIKGAPESEVGTVFRPRRARREHNQDSSGRRRHGWMAYALAICVVGTGLAQQPGTLTVTSNVPGALCGFCELTPSCPACTAETPRGMTFSLGYEVRDHDDGGVLLRLPGLEVVTQEFRLTGPPPASGDALPFDIEVVPGRSGREMLQIYEPGWSGNSAASQTYTCIELDEVGAAESLGQAQGETCVEMLINRPEQ